MGAEAVLHCLSLASGDVVWRRDLQRDFGVRQDFFGVSTTPLLEGDLLIVNAGAPDGGCVIAFDAADRPRGLAGGHVGAELRLAGPRRRARRAAGVRVRRAASRVRRAGGLLSIDPANGADGLRVSRSASRTYESVNASCPVVFDDRVFVSASYRTGGALVAVRPDFTHEVVWTTRDFALHYNTAIHRDGYLYGFDGRNMGDSSLACVDATSGQVVWREAPTWTETFEIGGRRGQQILGTARGSLLAADGQFLCLGELGHLLWMDLTPRGYREISRAWLFAARESWALPVLSRGLLYVVQNARDLIRGTAPRLLRATTSAPDRPYRTSSTRCVSLRRAPAMMPCMPMFPSWQAYSKSGPSVRRSGIVIVHGRE